MRPATLCPDVDFTSRVPAMSAPADIRSTLLVTTTDEADRGALVDEGRSSRWQTTYGTPPTARHCFSRAVAAPEP
jgi:hypothetical protein